MAIGAAGFGPGRVFKLDADNTDQRMTRISGRELGTPRFARSGSERRRWIEVRGRILARFDPPPPLTPRMPAWPAWAQPKTSLKPPQLSDPRDPIVTTPDPRGSALAY